MGWRLPHADRYMGACVHCARINVCVCVYLRFYYSTRSQAIQWTRINDPSVRHNKYKYCFYLDFVSFFFVFFRLFLFCSTCQFAHKVKVHRSNCPRPRDRGSKSTLMLSYRAEEIRRSKNQQLNNKVGCFGFIFHYPFRDNVVTSHGTVRSRDVDDDKNRRSGALHIHAFSKHEIWYSYRGDGDHRPFIRRITWPAREPLQYMPAALWPMTSSHLVYFLIRQKQIKWKTKTKTI